MKKFAIAALAATTLFTSPASATDRAFYVGIEGGLLFPRDETIDLSYEDSSGGIPLGAAGPMATVEVPSFFSVDYNHGRDLDLVAGYDFGLVRTELELANKRAGHDKYNFLFAYFGGETNGFEAEGHSRVNSAMVNVLLDVPVTSNVSLFAGPGIGIAKTKIDMRFVDDPDFGPLSELNTTIKDSGLALQAIAGVRVAVTPQIELGAKYRYFEASKVRDSYSTSDFICDTTCDVSTRFRSHSVLASLVYNFAAPVAPAPAPVIAPAPAPEPAPATQTCYDGSVILASDSCPLPPAPPAPTPTPERG